MKKFYLKSMGCKSNQFEGQIVLEKLIEAGYKEVKKLEKREKMRKELENKTKEKELQENEVE